MTLLDTLKTVGNRLSRPDILFWILPLMMTLLILGTLAQKTIGLYAAQEKFFGSFFVMLGPVPFPSGLTIMGIFLVNLLAKFLFKSDWSWQKTGTILSHFGVIVLVFGGLLTLLTSKEGYLVIPQGESSSTVEDYHERNLVIREGDKPVVVIPYGNLKDGFKIPHSANLPFDLTVDLYCFNCSISLRPENLQDGWEPPAKFMMLNKAEANPQDEKNMTGVEFTITESSGEHIKRLTFDGFPKPPVVTIEGKTYKITIEKAKRPLPFSITLDKFERTLHPGTDMASAFVSNVTINDTERGVSFPAKIEMNEPLRYRGLTFYQSSFDLSGDKPYTILTVVENKGRIFPYLASIIIALGLVVHLIVRIKNQKKLISLALLSSLLFYASSAHAKGPDLADFDKIPVLHEGRLKPLDTFARNELIRFSGKSEFEENPASVWLADTLFDPATAAQQKIFRIDNESVRHLLGVEERKKPLYAFSELTTGLEKTFPTVEQLMGKDTKSISADQKSLLSLHENAIEYTQLLRSFSLVLPLSVTLSPEWRKKSGLAPTEPPTYLALKKIDKEIEQAILSIIREKGENPASYTPAEQQIAILGWQIKTIEQAAGNNMIFRVIPDNWDKDSKERVAPWDMILSGKGSPESVKILEDWKRLAMAWQNSDTATWDATAADLAKDAPKTFKLEIFYNKIQPFRSSVIFFAAAFLLTLLAMSLGQKGVLIKGAIVTLLAALALQTGGLVARIVLLERPPVGTLYESILFVGLIAPLFAILFERKLKNHIGLLCAGLTGTAIGLLGLSMADEGDTMKVLTAVLNTKFWLTTHVLCITIGYGWCLVTSVLAHMILIGEATGKTDANALKTMRHSLGTLALTALLFTATGTILGGVWADQSWGRFWGWDPKENGALLIVLWLVWIIHGKIAGQCTPLLETIGLAFLSVIVGVAWIGVNLLGIGLHSYGFTEGLFWELGLFTLCEAILLGALGWRIRGNDKKEISYAA